MQSLLMDVEMSLDQGWAFFHALLPRLRFEAYNSMWFALLVFFGCWIGYLAFRRKFVLAILILLVASAVPHLFIVRLPRGSIAWMLISIAMSTYFVSRCGFQLKHLAPSERGLRTLRSALPLLGGVLLLSAVMIGLAMAITDLRITDGVIASPEMYPQLVIAICYWCILPACVSLGSTLWNGSWWRQLLVAGVLVSCFLTVSIVLHGRRLPLQLIAELIDIQLMLAVPLLILRASGFRLVFERPVRQEPELVPPKSPFDD